MFGVVRGRRGGSGDTLIVPIVATQSRVPSTSHRGPSSAVRPIACTRTVSPRRTLAGESSKRTRRRGRAINGVVTTSSQPSETVVYIIIPTKSRQKNLKKKHQHFSSNMTTTRHHLEVAAATATMPLDRTISLNVHNRHGAGAAASGTTSSQSSLKDRWYSFRYRPRGGTGNDGGDRHHRRSNVEEFLFMESLPDVPTIDVAAASEVARAPDGQEIELSIIIRKDTIRRDLMDSMRTCNGRLQLMELVELNEFDPGGVLPSPSQSELDRLFCWAIYVGAPAECLDSLYNCGANLHYSHCGNFTAIHLAAFMGNADALRYRTRFHLLTRVVFKCLNRCMALLFFLFLL